MASEKISELQTQLETKDTVRELKELVGALLTSALKVSLEHKLQLRVGSDSNLHLEYIED